MENRTESIYTRSQNDVVEQIDILKDHVKELKFALVRTNDRYQVRRAKIDLSAMEQMLELMKESMKSRWEMKKQNEIFLVIGE